MLLWEPKVIRPSSLPCADVYTVFDNQTIVIWKAHAPPLEILGATRQIFTIDEIHFRGCGNPVQPIKDTNGMALLLIKLNHKRLHDYHY